MISLFRRKTHSLLLLGRWSSIPIKKQLERSERSNHDHSYDAINEHKIEENEESYFTLFCILETYPTIVVKKTKKQ